MDGIEAGWHPDPTGRHELRYWDGGDWTAHVSDAGVTALDPLAPVAAAVAGGPAGVSPAARPRRPWRLIGLALVVAVAVAGGLIAFVGGGDGGGGDPFGTRRLAVGEDGRQVAVVLDLEVGQAIRYRAIQVEGDRDIELSLVSGRDLAVSLAEHPIIVEIFSDIYPDLSGEELADELYGPSGYFTDNADLDGLGLDIEEYFHLGVQSLPGPEEGASGWFAPLIDGRYYLVLAERDGVDTEFVVTIEEWDESVVVGDDAEEDAEQFEDEFFTDEDWFLEFDAAEVSDG